MARILTPIIVAAFVVLAGADKAKKHEIDEMPVATLRKFAKEQAKRIVELEKRPDIQTINVKHPASVSSPRLTAEFVTMTSGKRTDRGMRSTVWEIVFRINNVGTFEISEAELVVVLDGRAPTDVLERFAREIRISQLPAGESTFEVVKLSQDASPKGRISLDVQSMTTVSP
jgi:hypothetical protein